jgi:hypothetical protein
MAFTILACLSNTLATELDGRYEYPLPAGLSNDTGGYSWRHLRPDLSATGKSELRSGPNHVRTTYLASTLWTGMEDVVVEGNYAYCGLVNGVMILDISVVSNPTMLSQLYLPGGQVVRLTKSGNLLYVSDGLGGMRIVDVSEPAHPRALGSIVVPVNGFASDVAISGHFAYLANGLNGLRIVDVSNPMTPLLIGRYYTRGFSRGVEIFGDTAFLDNEYAGMDIVSLSNPVSPVLIGSTFPGPGVFGIPYYELGVRGNFLYAACRDTCLVFDVSNPASPTRVAYMPRRADYYDLAFRDVDDEFGHRTLLYTVDEWEYDIFDITDSLNPIATSLANGPDNDVFYHLALTPEYTFIPCNFSGLWILDGEHFQDTVGRYHAPGWIRDIAIEGNRAYVVSNNEGVRILDISNPESPTTLGAFLLNDYASEVERYAFEGNRMCLVKHGYPDTLLIIDATDPLNLTYYAYPVKNYLAAVAIKGNRVYLSEYMSLYLRILDISDPEAATEIGHYQSPDFRAMCFAVDGDLTYLCTYSGLEILNTGDPSNIVLIGTCPNLLNTPYDIKIHNGRAYIIGTGGCQVVDVSNPASPVTLAVRDTIEAPAIDISADGNFAYVGGVEHGVGIYETNSAVPLNEAGHLSPSGYAWRAIPVGNLLYVTNEYSFIILQTEITTCGDPNGDGDTDISDPVYLISYIFAGGPPPVAGVNSDVNCDGAVDISDVVCLISYIFAGGPTPCAACK